MTRQSLLAATLALSLAAAAPAMADSSFTGIYAFGDSLSDVGNLYYGLGGAFGPVSPPYFYGRFSSGPVWVEDVSNALGLGAVTPSLFGGNDYAVGGASTGTTDVHAASFGDLPWQLQQFEASPTTISPTTLFTLSIGANDVFGAISALLGGTPVDLAGVVGQAAANTAAFITALHGDGAENLLLFDVPNLDLIPRFNTLPPGFYPAGVPTPGDLAALFNADLLGDLEPLVAGGFRLFDIDTYDKLGDVVANPKDYGLDNVTDACWTGNYIDANSGAVCSDPGSYLFWDGVHPTGIGHAIVAEFALAAIPEPSTWAMALIGFGALGLAAARRVRRAVA
jgi:phospholipase/lecithinase/hemolysin